MARLQWDGTAEQERQTAAFLRAHPGWLAANPELYAVLQPPRRVHGEAMADHMAAMLEQARRHGNDAAAGRRASDGFTQRVQDAVLALMRAPDPAWCLQHDVPGLLRVEAVRLLAEGDVPGAAPMPAGTTDAVLGQRGVLVRDAGADKALHGEVAPLVAQEAIVRVRRPGAPVLLLIAARDPAGLDGAGTPALQFLGDAVAAALDRT